MNAARQERLMTSLLAFFNRGLARRLDDGR